MSAKVLHLGADICQRLLVLNSVGYFVEVCLTLPEFRSLIKQRADAEAVLVASERISERREVVRLTRENTHAGLILFDPIYSGACEGEFDLVITPLTRPEEWLRKIADLIEHSRTLNAQSKAIRERSALGRNAENVRQGSSIFQCERTARERAEAQRIIKYAGQNSDPSGKC